MKRFWMLAGAFLVTITALGIALLLGSASFDFRRFSQHEGRLRRVLREQPTAERLTRGLADEGTPLLATALRPEDVERLIAAYGGKKATEIREKAGRFAQMRVFRAADMLYFVYFDAGGVMRDFTCVSR
jgi:hypothetical protein